MIVKACITNCCGLLKSMNEVYGIVHTPVLFNQDREKEFKTVDAEKTNIHYCVECYQIRVIQAAGATVKRKNNEDKYQLALKELAYHFKKMLFDRQQIENIKNNLP